MNLHKSLIAVFLSVAFFSCKKEEAEKNITPEWNIATEFPGVGRQNAVAFSIGQKGYIGLGNGDGTAIYNDFWEFNSDGKIWTKKADFPGTVRAAPTGFSIGNKGYVVNGLCNCNDFWEYDPFSKSQWNKKADFPVSGLYYTAAFVINGKAYVGTGIKDGTLQKGIWEYDPQFDKWTPKSDYPGIPMDVAVGFSIAGKGYFATGNQAVGESKSFWQYDPNSDTWTRKADYPYATSSLVGFSINDKGYVGLGGAGNEFWEYDPMSDTWYKMLNFKGGTRTAAKAFVINNTAYVGLGTSSWTVYPKDIWTLTK
jgi:N-acetylneuraminic acid mutarotase